jgi:16S rRNA (guanine1207-N2)-methyltransferase
MTVKASVGAVDDTPSGHYFDVTPAARSVRRHVPLVLPDLSVELVTDRGVFSMTRVDPGTRYLLMAAPAPSGEEREIVDLGCGYGPIAVTLARRAPSARVWAVDVNERALELTRENAAGLALDGLVVARPDEVPTAVELDGIWSNPPVRIGKAALHALLMEWLPRLRSGGHAYLVVQKHLGADSLQRWLTEAGWPTIRLGSRAGYRLLDVVREDA